MRDTHTCGRTHGRAHGRASGRAAALTGGRTNGQAGARAYERKGEQTDGRAGGRTRGWTHEQAGEQAGGWTDEPPYEHPWDRALVVHVFLTGRRLFNAAQIRCGGRSHVTEILALMPSQNCTQGD